MSDEMNEHKDERDGAWGEATAEQAGATSSHAAGSNNVESYEKAQFGRLQNEGSLSTDEVNLDVILDIPVTLSVEIGRTRQTIRNLLQLNQGSVVELDRFAGEPLDVLVNGTLIAHGEIVVVNEKFGIRLTDVISATERVKKLK
ncbi:MAG: flagellar motor switch protein FliN [Gammaproteobacteria bacterium]